LTGSQNLLLMDRVTESLAGRAAIIRLLPLSPRKMQGESWKPFPWERPPNRPPSHGPASLDLWRSFLRGGFPELAVEPDRDIGLWHASYLQTYLERDQSPLLIPGDTREPLILTHLNLPAFPLAAAFL
jgi:predicted AAA+ superfamily ATPase